MQGVSEIFHYTSPPITAPNPPYFAGASYFLYHKHKLPVKGSEHKGALKLTHQLYREEKPRSYIMAAHEEREKQMLKNITRNLDFNNTYDSSIKFLLCGEAHDFENNIKQWNLENPNQKFNLLVYKP